MHPLQITFATGDGESAWTENLRTLIETARFDEAEQVLEEALELLDTDIGRLCAATTADSVTISGWPELAERIELQEGEEPITALTIAIGNDADLAFEKGRLLAPYMMLGLYTDEAWDWSGASRELLLEECAKETPAWAGTDEDLEAFLDIEGLDALNTALIHAKQRHFIRETEEDSAPLRYVEYIVGCWYRALRFHQAVAAAETADPLPGGLTIVSGMVDMRPDVVAVHLAVDGSKAASPRPSKTAPIKSAKTMALAPIASVHVPTDESCSPPEASPLLSEPDPTAGTPPTGIETDFDAGDPDIVGEADEHLTVPCADTVIEAEADGSSDEGDQEVELESCEPSLDLISRGMITRKPILEEKSVSGSDLRRRVSADVANHGGSAARTGFFARLFGRR